MTFEMKMRRLLEDNGLFDKQINTVIDLAKESLSDMKGRWGDEINEYPNTMTNIVWISVKQVAIKWIEKELPQAWFKPMFL